MIGELLTNHRDSRQPVNRVDLLMLTVDGYLASQSPFDCCGHVVAQLLRSLQRPFNPDNLHLAGRDLSSRFVVASRGHQAALVAGQHAPKDRYRTLFRLRVCTAKAYQSLRTMFSGGQGAEVCAHIAQVAARSEGRPFRCSRVFQSVFRRSRRYRDCGLSCDTPR